MRGSCFILRGVLLSTLALEKIMPSSRCVVQGCSNPSNPKAGILLYNFPVKPSFIRAQWKRFVSAHRANFNPPGRFDICSEHFTEDCFAGTIHVGGAMKRLQPSSVPIIWKKKDKGRFTRYDFCPMRLTTCPRHDLRLLCTSEKKFVAF